jgi:peptidoglycan-N-acetylglucosamine deacetylase
VHTLRQHTITGVFGFINAARAADDSGPRALEPWLAAGHPLGNHTFTHANLDEISVADYTADIEKNDAFLAAMLGDDPAARARRRTFRYPFLREGRDAATIDAVQAYLRQNHYRIAEVTIDFGDWAYNGPYARCVARDARDAIDGLRRDFIERALYVLDWSKATAAALYGRPIPHVLVLHTGSFDALVLDELLSAYERARRAECRCWLFSADNVSKRARL